MTHGCNRTRARRVPPHSQSRAPGLPRRLCRDSRFHSVRPLPCPRGPSAFSTPVRLPPPPGPTPSYHPEIRPVLQSNTQTLQGEEVPLLSGTPSVLVLPVAQGFLGSVPEVPTTTLLRPYPSQGLPGLVPIGIPLVCVRCLPFRKLGTAHIC